MSNIEIEEERTTGEMTAKSFVYSHVPMLLIDQKGIVKEINCALRELMGTDLAGCKGQSCTHLTHRLDKKLQGDLFPSQGIVKKRFLSHRALTYRTGVDDLDIAEATRHYDSREFGPSKLRIIEIPLIDPSTGDINGALLTLEVLELDRLGLYQKALRKRWVHELMWETYAASYDRILLEMPFYQEVLQRHFAAMNTHSINNILDLGTGTGNLAVRLLQAGKSITAVDISHAMLQKLFSKLNGKTGTNLTIIEDTAERLPHLQDGGFDGVTAMLVFFDMQYPKAALEEAVRLLKPGGTLIVTDPKECFNVSKLMEFAERHLRQRGLLPKLEVDWIRIQTVAPHVDQKIQEAMSESPAEPGQYIWNAEIIYEHLIKRGFINLTFEDSHLGNCATIKGVKPG